MILVADASALIALATCDSLTLLEALLGSVLVPEAVYAEITALDKLQSARLQSYLKGKVCAVDMQHFVYLDAFADAGETQAMLLYKDVSADYTSSGQEFRFLKSLKYRVCGIPIVVAAGVDSGFLLPLQPRTPTRCRAHRARLQAQVTSDQVTTINTQYLPV